MTTRDEYVEKFKAELDELNAEIDRVEAKAKQAKADVKAKHEQEIVAIRQKRDKVRGAKLREVQSASSEAWHDIKHVADNAWHAVRDAVTEAVGRFR